MRSDEIAYCRVCGFDPEEFPWGADGTEPSWEICPCCGVEYGYDDATIVGVARYRQSWLDAGAPWADLSTPKDGLDLAERLMRVPERYR